MRQLFKIDESEKKRILEMHENATKKNYLMEQTIAKCLNDKNSNLSDFIQKVGANNLCAMLAKVLENNVTNNFIGEFMYKAVTAQDNPETGPPTVETKTNARSEVTFYTIWPNGYFVELFSLRLYSGRNLWETFNNDYELQYGQTSNKAFLDEIKNDKSPTRMVSVNILSRVIKDEQQFGGNVVKLYFQNLLKTLPPEDIRKQTFDLAIAEVKKTEKGQQLAQQLGV
jgi:hypothetical protein